MTTSFISFIIYIIRRRRGKKDLEIKNRLIKCGYDYGFECPPIDSDDTYPEHIKNEVELAIERINTLESEDTFSFVFATDLHYLPLRHHKIYLERNLNAFREIIKRTNARKLIFGGDYVIDSPKEAKRNGYKELRDAFSEFCYLPANGNHNRGSLWDAFMENEKPINKLTREEVYDSFFAHLENEGAVFDKTNEKSLYYYLDSEEGVRYIFLDICDNPGAKCHSFSQSQIDWLINIALDTKNDIIITLHSVLRPEITEPKDKLKNPNYRLEILNFILDAYKNGEKLSESFYEDEYKISIDVDFSKVQRANIAGVFVGHFHRDFIEYTKSNIPYIFTANFFMAECHIPRSVGDSTELLFEVVTVDRKSVV